MARLWKRKRFTPCETDFICGYSRLWKFLRFMGGALERQQDE